MSRTAGMKGGGFYDAHSNEQRAAIDAFLPWLKSAVADLPFDSEAGAPITLLDIGSAEGGDGLLEGAASPQLRTDLLEHLVGVAFVTKGTTCAKGRGLRIEPHEPSLNPEVEADALPRSALEPTDLSDLARHLQHETMPSCELRRKCCHRRGPRDHGAFRPW